jgi:hypothetical protein
MEIYAEAPRSIEDVGSILAQQTNRQRGTHLAPHDVFSEIPDVTWTDFFEPLFTLLDWGGKYIFCGICLVTVIKFLTWLMGNLTRLYEALGEFGCSPKLLLVCMPFEGEPEQKERRMMWRRDLLYCQKKSVDPEMEKAQSQQHLKRYVLTLSPGRHTSTCKKKCSPFITNSRKGT